MNWQNVRKVIKCVTTELGVPFVTMKEELRDKRQLRGWKHLLSALMTPILKKDSLGCP